MNETIEKESLNAVTEDIFDAEQYNKPPLTAGKIVLRCFIAFFTVLFLLVIGVYLTLLSIARGPSETVRNMLVLSARQASATKWMPQLFLDEETINEIYENSDKITVDVMSAEEYAEKNKADNETQGVVVEDEWDGASDGMVLKIENGSTYKAYVLLVKDPSRVFVGTSSDNYDNATIGMDIFNVVER